MRKLLNILYSLYFNFRYLPLSKAIYLPIYVTTNLCDVKLRRGQIIIDAPMSYKLIQVGGVRVLVCSALILDCISQKAEV